MPDPATMPPTTATPAATAPLGVRIAHPDEITPAMRAAHAWHAVEIGEAVAGAAPGVTVVIADWTQLAPREPVSETRPARPPEAAA